MLLGYLLKGKKRKEGRGLFDAKQIVLVNEVVEANIFFAEVFILSTQNGSSEAIIFADFLFEGTVFLLASGAVNFDEAFNQDSALGIGDWREEREKNKESALTLRSEFEDELGLIDKLVAADGFVRIEEQEVDSAVAIGEDDQEDEGDANEPSNNARLEESGFHELKKNRKKRKEGELWQSTPLWKTTN